MIYIKKQFYCYKNAFVLTCALLLLCVFLSSCSQPNDISTFHSGIEQGYVPEVSANNFAPGQLEAHYLKHRYEFGDITQEKYLENARLLLNSMPSKDVLEKRRPNGDVLHFRVSSGEFAVMTSDGRIRSYFKTDYRYWMKQ